MWWYGISYQNKGKSRAVIAKKTHPQDCLIVTAYVSLSVCLSYHLSICLSVSVCLSSSINLLFTLDMFRYQRSEDSFVVSVLFFYYVGLRNWIWVVRLDNKHLFLLSYLTAYILRLIAKKCLISILYIYFYLFESVPHVYFSVVLTSWFSCFSLWSTEVSG